MKRAFLITLLATLILTFPVSCNKMSHNGDLDGRWQITHIRYHSTGQEIDGPVRIYWDFNLALMTISDLRPGKSFFTYGRFDHKGDRLRISTIRATIPQVRPRGLCDTIVDFRVITLTHSQMVLNSDSTLVEFRKF